MINNMPQQNDISNQIKSAKVPVKERQLASWRTYLAIACSYQQIN
jgi:hypothetical protein